MNLRIAQIIGLFIVFASVLKARPSGADNDAAFRKQLATSTREEMVVDNGLTAALADFNEIVLMKLDVPYGKKVTDRRQKKFDDSDLKMLCAYGGNPLTNTPTATPSQCLGLARLWTLTYFPALQHLTAAYLQGRRDALAGP